MVSRQEILESAWDSHWYGPTKVLDVHVAALRRKLGEPGLIEVFETDGMRRVEVTRTEMGAHTLGFDQAHHMVYAFLPDSHRALVFHDRG